MGVEHNDGRVARVLVRELRELAVDAAFDLRLKGGVDAWIYDQLSVMRYHTQQPDSTRVLLKPLREEVWAVALKKGDDALREKVNAFLKKYRSEGGFKKLADKYLAEEAKMMQAEGIPFVFDL